MPTIALSVDHSLGRDEALRRLQGESEALKAAFGGSVSDLRENWRDSTLDFSLVAYGLPVSGDIAVQAAAVDASIKLPLAAAMFKGTIERRVRSRLEELLAVDY